MKALFIWREESVSFIKNIINKQFSEDVKYITSESDFNKFVPDYHKTSKDTKINKELKLKRTKRQNDLNSYSKIYILAELGWEKGFVFNGYRIAFEIMRKWQGNKSPCIQIFSIVDRKLIRNQIDDKYKYLVKSMPFVDLAELNPTHKISTKNMNPYVWKSIKYLALSEVGILDNFVHRLETIDFKKANSKFSLDLLIDEIKSYETFIGEDVLEVLDTVYYSLDYTSKLRGMIESRMSEIGGKTKKTIDIPEALNILVVDDNIEELETFKSSLKRYKNHVEYITSGKEALKLIKEDNFHLIISDLELLDKDGFYQEVQGVEIYDAVLNSKSSVIGIVTGLGRKGVVKLLKIEESFILPKKNLRKFDVDEEIDGLLKNLLSEFKIKEDSVHIDFGPKIGSQFFTKKGFKTILARYYNDDSIQDKLNEAFKHFNDFRNKNEPNKSWSKEIGKGDKEVNYTEFIEKRIVTLFTNRLILLFLSIKNDEKLFINSDEEEYSGFLEKYGININKNRIYTVCGISVSKKQNHWKVTIKDLFPHELDFVDYLQKEYNHQKADITIFSHLKSTYNWIEKYFRPVIESLDLNKTNNNFETWTINDFENILELILNSNSSLLEEAFQDLNKQAEAELMTSTTKIKKLIGEIDKEILNY